MEKFIQQHDNVKGTYIALEKESKKVKKFAKDLGLKTPIVMDKFESIAKRHGIIQEGKAPSIPKTFLIDKEGNVLQIIVLEGEDFGEVLSKSLPSE